MNFLGRLVAWLFDSVFGIGQWLTVFMLIPMAFVGVITVMFAMALIDFLREPKWEHTRVFALMLAFTAALNVGSFAMIRWVTRKPAEWTLRGERREIWKILFIAAYISGAMLTALFFRN